MCGRRRGGAPLPLALRTTYNPARQCSRCVMRNNRARAPRRVARRRRAGVRGEVCGRRRGGTPLPLALRATNNPAHQCSRCVMRNARARAPRRVGARVARRRRAGVRGEVCGRRRGGAPLPLALRATNNPARQCSRCVMRNARAMAPRRVGARVARRRRAGVRGEVCGRRRGGMPLPLALHATNNPAHQCSRNVMRYARARAPRRVGARVARRRRAGVRGEVCRRRTGGAPLSLRPIGQRWSR